jgi:hypothetical protein
LFKRHEAAALRQRDWNVEPPGRPHLLAFEPPNLLIMSYPMVMVPTFAVPLDLMLHGVALWRLRRESASNGRLAAA